MIGVCEAGRVKEEAGGEASGDDEEGWQDAV